MERFAIKIDKSIKSKLKNLCRLCGIDNPNQIDILNNEESIVIDDDDEVSLSRKIHECVGIQVMKSDRMPQRICMLCVDKINDFHEYRQMCIATNAQTRNLLNLPPEQPKKIAAKKIGSKCGKDAESIFGIVGEEFEVKIEPNNKTTKKTKKSIATFDECQLDRGLTQDEIEMALKRELEEQGENSNRSRSKKTKKGTAKVSGLLLAPKELNSRERKREIDQKKIDKKRKADKPKKSQKAKKVKKEPGASCTLCVEWFSTTAIRDNHMQLNHSPNIAAFGCSSCVEQFATVEDNTAHHEWHRMFNILYKCNLCSASFEKCITFQRHVTACKNATFHSIPVIDNIYCDICHLEFETQNLFDWHDCFIKNNAPCSKCGRVFIKKMILFKHLVKCDGMPMAINSSGVKASKQTSKAKKRTGSSRTILHNNFKREPETIIETNIDETDQYDEADSFMDTHFGDSDDDYEMSDSIIAAPKSQTQNDTRTKNTPQNISITKIHGRPQRSNKSRKSTASTSVSNTNLLYPLPQCSVKLEPIDISQYMVSVPSTSYAEPNEQIIMANIPADLSLSPIATTSKPTVPPLTIRIKKEIIHSGYSDVFDSVVARNIKQEKSDETWELVNNASNDQVTNEEQAAKKAKKHDKPNKLYKKPALLAIKIKQERIEREDEEPYDDGYQEFPAQEFNGNVPSQRPEISLPIITQIHSALDSDSIHQPADQSSMLPNPFSLSVGVSENVQKTSDHPVVSIPFKPIRIKRERLSPPPSPNLSTESFQQIPDSTSTEAEGSLFSAMANEDAPDPAMDELTADNSKNTQFTESMEIESSLTPVTDELVSDPTTNERVSDTIESDNTTAILTESIEDMVAAETGGLNSCTETIEEKPDSTGNIEKSEVDLITVTEPARESEINNSGNVSACNSTGNEDIPLDSVEHENETNMLPELVANEHESIACEINVAELDVRQCVDLNASTLDEMNENVSNSTLEELNENVCNFIDQLVNEAADTIKSTIETNDAKIPLQNGTEQHMGTPHACSSNETAQNSVEIIVPIGLKEIDENLLPTASKLNDDNSMDESYNFETLANKVVDHTENNVLGNLCEFTVHQSDEFRNIECSEKLPQLQGSSNEYPNTDIESVSKHNEQN